MTRHYPHIRLYAQSGYLLIRDGLTITFYMKLAHEECAPIVLRALETYLRAVGPEALDIHTDEEGHWRNLEMSARDYIQQGFLEDRFSSFHLANSSISENRYQFEYNGKYAETLSSALDPEAVSAVSFWLPTEYLEEHGPARVRQLAVDISACLPFCSGHAGLSFNCDTGILGILRELRALCFRYPGMDIPEDSTSWQLGFRLRGPSWLNFLGPPVLASLGGLESLRSQLHSPDTSVQALDSERALVTLGPWPEAGDLEHGQTLPAYRELARLFEPWLFHRRPLGGNAFFPPEDWHRWERRFLEP